jgi:hypothetical protein
MGAKSSNHTASGSQAMARLCTLVVDQQDVEQLQTLQHVNAP